MSAEFLRGLDKDFDPQRGADVARVVSRFGTLASWWLQPDLLRRAAAHTRIAHLPERPPLPQTLGSCWIVCGTVEQSRWLRSACLLPLCWRKGTDHSPRLPESLRQLAEQVLQQSNGKENSDLAWGLQLHPRLGSIDLSRLEESVLQVDSGWASVYAGLSLVLDGIHPQQSVAASAAWDPRYGIGPVERVETKLEEIVAAGIEEFFVPAENVRRALEVCSQREWDRLKVRQLNATVDSPNPKRLLEPYLGSLGAPPGPDAPFETRRAYYFRLPRSRCNTYYWSHLLDDDVRSCREHFLTCYPKCRPTHLVTIASPSPGGVALAPLAIGVRDCLLFYDEDEFGDEKNRKQLDELTEKLQAAGINVSPPCGLKLGSRTEELRGIARRVRQFVEGVDPARLVFDLTPGFKSLSFGLREQAVPGNWLVYCRHEQMEEDRRPEPGSQRYDCWQISAASGAER